MSKTGIFKCTVRMGNVHTLRNKQLKKYTSRRTSGNNNSPIQRREEGRHFKIMNNNHKNAGLLSLTRTVRRRGSSPTKINAI